MREIEIYYHLEISHGIDFDTENGICVEFYVQKPKNSE